MKKLVIACISLMLLLTTAKTSLGESQNSIAPEQFDGYFRQEAYVSSKPNANSPISGLFLFQESGNGSKFAVYIPFFFAPSPQREFKIQGLFIKKFLPEKANNEDYRRIILSAWPDFTSGDTKQAIKVIKDWMKKNPDIPLLLVNLLHRVEPPVKDAKHFEAPKQIKKVRPVFPESARRQHIDGTVVFEIVIDEDGIVEQIKVIQGNVLLVPAAIDAVKQWRFSPTLIDGKAVAVEILFEVSFNFL